MSRFKHDRLLLRQSATTQQIPRAAHRPEDEISCLLDLGFSDAHLDQIRRHASALNLSSAQFVMAKGLVTESDFYRAFAEHIGARFLTQIPPFARDSDWAHALRSGHARLQNGRWIFAPQGRALALLKSRLTRPRAQDVLITSPSVMRQAFAAQMRKRLASHAAHHLARQHPDSSAQSGVSHGQKRALSLICGLIVFGVIDGGALWALCCAIFSAAIAFGVAMRLIGTARALPATQHLAPPLSDGHLPFYTLLVPLYRESNILDQIITNLCALDYPRARHEILLLIEQDDEETRAALAQITLPPHVETILIPAGRPRTKPRALNIGLLYARGDYLVVYDAEDRPETDQLRKAASAFAQGGPKLACLQASLAIDNAKETWITHLFALDYASHFDVLHWGHSRLNLPLPLGGTSNHFRTSVLRDIGGWDAWNVTEDADLGLRLARRGWTCRMLASTTFEEAPPSFQDWLPQRRRWMKGWMQTFLTHTRHPLVLWQEIGPVRAAHILALLIANTFGPLVGIWLSVYVLWHAWLGDLLDANQTWTSQIADLAWAGLAMVGFLSIFIPTLIGAGRRRLVTSLPWLALRPIYWLCNSIASLQALIELVRNPFHWAKTRHGLSKDRGPNPA